ncbi:MAG: aldose epimerase family protein, partial [Bacteroidota bacterium]
KGKFSLDGKEYTLAKNNGKNHLHGGLKGFDKVGWSASTSQTDSAVSLQLHYLSKDMEEGYPGNLDATVIYTLTDGNELQIEYVATTDKKTIVNLTHHSYFNLSGDCKRDILNHELVIAAEGFTPVDASLIPTGEIRSVHNSPPFDFRLAKPIGKDIAAEYDQLKFGQGYDHNWALNNWMYAGNGQLQLAARIFEPESGRFMEVLTTEPGLQFYSGNFLDGKIVGKGGKIYQDRAGFCLETQHFPDSPNRWNFPSTVLEPGKEYKSLTVYRFSVRK